MKNLEAKLRIMDKDVQIMYSYGKGKNGKTHVYIRPCRDCFNKSRRLGGYSYDEIYIAVKKCIAKWYSPMNYYTIDGKIIGSNSEQNALKEYWRVCDKSIIGKLRKVKDTDHSRTVL